MDQNSNVVFVSCDPDKVGDSLVESLLVNLPELTVKEGLNVYPWHISTKYYEVDVDVCVLSRKELLSPEFSESTEGVVLYFDCNSADWNQNITGWLPFLKGFESEIKILLCDKCSDDVKNDVIDWCLKEKYELVEIHGVVEDEDFPETVGIARVKQALEAHVWPNLSMKERREPTKITDLLSGLNRIGRSDDEDLALYLSDALEQDRSEDTMAFEGLFSHLMFMKQKAAGMEPDKRKEFAEKVVTAYWNVIGGDSDELSDDSSTDETEYKKL